MPPADFLGILVDKITELASSIQGRLIHASSDFEVATWDVSRLLAILLEVKNEASEPESKLHNASEAKRDDLHVLIESFRPLLEDLEKLVAKDQGLKKKRIWRRDKDNAAALDHIHRQLELRTQKVDFHLSTLRNRQLFRVEKKLKDFIEELRRSGGESLRRPSPVEGKSEADAQFSVLRRELAEIGLKDVDIEAHESTLKAILRERLPSYHEAQFAPSRAEPSQLSLGAALSRTSEPEHHMPIKTDSTTQGPGMNKDDAFPAFQSDIAAQSSGRNESKGMFYINDSTDSESEILHDDMERVTSKPSGLHINAKASAKTPHPQQPGVGHPCCLCHQVFTSSKKLEQHETEMHPRGLVWSCAAIKTYEAAYFDLKDSDLVTICGFCGQTFPKSPETGWAGRRGHLNDVHNWTVCHQETQFYRAGEFRLHLKLSHAAVGGWWLDELQRRVRRPHLEPNRDSFSRRRNGSLSNRAPLNSPYEDRSLYHDGMMPRPPSSMSRTSSMHRVRSDVSEYDAQGNLTRRTITTSYSSLPDAAAVSSQRHHSSPGPQPHLPFEALQREAALGTRQGKPQPAVAHDQTKHDLSCPFCLEPPRFGEHESVARHLRTSHPDLVACPRQAQKHDKLKQALERRTRQLYKALQSLKQNETTTKNASGKDTRVTDFITNTLRELDVDSTPSSPEDVDDIDADDIDFSISDTDDEDWALDPSTMFLQSKVHNPG